MYPEKQQGDKDSSEGVHNNNQRENENVSGRIQQQRDIPSPRRDRRSDEDHNPTMYGQRGRSGRLLYRGRGSKMAKPTRREGRRNARRGDTDNTRAERELQEHTRSDRNGRSKGGHKNAIDRGDNDEGHKTLLLHKVSGEAGLDGLSSLHRDVPSRARSSGDGSGTERYNAAGGDESSDRPGTSGGSKRPRDDDISGENVGNKRHRSDVQGQSGSVSRHEDLPRTSTRPGHLFRRGRTGEDERSSKKTGKYMGDNTDARFKLKVNRDPEDWLQRQQVEFEAERETPAVSSVKSRIISMSRLIVEMPTIYAQFTGLPVTAHELLFYRQSQRGLGLRKIVRRGDYPKWFPPSIPDIFRRGHSGSVVTERSTGDARTNTDGCSLPFVEAFVSATDYPHGFQIGGAVRSPDALYKALDKEEADSLGSRESTTANSTLYVLDEEGVEPLKKAQFRAWRASKMSEFSLQHSGAVMSVQQIAKLRDIYDQTEEEILENNTDERFIYAKTLEPDRYVRMSYKTRRINYVNATMDIYKAEVLDAMAEQAYNQSRYDIFDALQRVLSDFDELYKTWFYGNGCLEGQLARLRSVNDVGAKAWDNRHRKPGGTLLSDEVALDALDYFMPVKSTQHMIPLDYEQLKEAMSGGGGEFYLTPSMNAMSEVGYPFVGTAKRGLNIDLEVGSFSLFAANPIEGVDEDGNVNTNIYNSWARRVYLKPKEEAVMVEKFYKKIRNIMVYNSGVQWPASIVANQLLNANDNSSESVYNDQSGSLFGIPITTEGGPLMGSIIYNFSKEEYEGQTRVFVYADNIFVISRKEGRIIWRSLDGVKMEGSHVVFEQMVDLATYIASTTRNYDELAGSWFETQLLSTIACSINPIGVIGEVEFQVYGMGTGCALTFAMNHFKMSHVAAAIQQATMELSDLSAINELIASTGVQLDTEFESSDLDIKGLMSKPFDLMNEPGVLRLDLLGYDLGYVKIGDFVSFICVLNKERLMKAMFTPEVVISEYVKRQMTEDQIYRSRKADAVYSTLLYNILYYIGGWYYPDLSLALKTLMSESLARVDNFEFTGSVLDAKILASTVLGRDIDEGTIQGFISLVEKGLPTLGNIFFSLFGETIVSEIQKNFDEYEAAGLNPTELLPLDRLPTLGYELNEREIKMRESFNMVRRALGLEELKLDYDRAMKEIKRVEKRKEDPVGSALDFLGIRTLNQTSTKTPARKLIE